MNVLVSPSEQAFVSESVALNVRLDGRTRLDFRALELEVGVIPLANGSARLRLGSTDVLVAVKVEVGVPDEATPDQGRISCSVDFSPCASLTAEGRSGDDISKQLTAALQKIYSPGYSGKGCGFDLSSLAIISGQSCWLLYIDAVVLNAGGNVLDACSIAARAALANTAIPSVAVVENEGSEEPEIEVDDDPSACVLLDTSQIPVLITLSAIGQHIVADCSAREEACGSASLAVAINASSRVCGVVKFGGGCIGARLLTDMIAAARAIAPRIIAAADSFSQSAGGTAAPMVVG